MLAGLKAHSGNIANTFRTQNLAELLKPCSRKRRKRFWQLRKFAEAYETAAPVCQFRNIFSGPAACDFLQEFGRETALHRGQHGSQCHRRRQQLEGEGILALRIAEKIKGAI